MNPLTDNSTTGGAMGGATLTSGQYVTGGGNANVSVATLVGVSLGLIVLLHVLGFRFAFDVSVGRK